MLIRGLLVGLVVVAAACTREPDREPEPSPAAEGVTFRTHDDTLVIVGTDAEHVIITEPLVEVLPPTGGVPAVMRLAFETIGNMGVEGGIGFVSAYTPGGELVLDRVVDIDGDSIDIPGGEYTLRLYFRPCDGWCGLLDPPIEWCALEHTFVAGAEYDLTVTGHGFGSANCSLQEAPESGSAHPTAGLRPIGLLKTW